MVILRCTVTVLSHQNQIRPPSLRHPLERPPQTQAVVRTSTADLLDPTRTAALDRTKSWPQAPRSDARSEPQANEEPADGMRGPPSRRGAKVALKATNSPEGGSNRRVTPMKPIACLPASIPERTVGFDLGDRWSVCCVSSRERTSIRPPKPSVGKCKP